MSVNDRRLAPRPVDGRTIRRILVDRNDLDDFIEQAKKSMQLRGRSRTYRETGLILACIVCGHSKSA